MQMKGSSTIPEDVKHILLLQLGDIGDVVLSLPCLRALREQFPQARLMVAVREKAKELIEDCPWADGVIAIGSEKRSFLQELICQKRFFSYVKGYHFDLSINLRLGDRSALLPFLGGIRQRISFFDPEGRLWRNRLSTHLNNLEYKTDQYVGDYYLSLLEAYNIKPTDPRPRMEVPMGRIIEADSLFSGAGIPSKEPLVVLQPFSLWRYKEWTTANYIELVRRIKTDFGFPVLIVGAAEEKNRASSIAEGCGPGVYNLTGRTSIGLLSAVLKRSSLFIGVDSAGMHIAAAVGTPTVTIFGPSSPVSWAPRGSGHRVVQSRLPCVPCRQKGCAGSEQSRCLEELPVSEVMAAVASQLGNLSQQVVYTS
ncbi:MAG: glycosyltransferase family 9 protein [Thermodesulfobacteriota bacterium]